MKDVAALAGVAPSTVSYVLNNHASIGEETRARVLKAVEQLGYRRNMNAASLRNNATGAIGVIIPNITNPFYSEISLGVEKVAQEQGYLLNYGHTHYAATLTQRYLEAFVDRRADGIILVDAVPENVPLLRHCRIPVVLVDPRPTVVTDEFPVVDTAEERLAACDLITHLVRLGHQRIALLNLGSGGPRHDGYLAALQEAGLSNDPALVLSAQDTVDLIALGEQLAQRLLASGAAPTAIFGATDQMALGAMKALREMGLRIPDDIAVVGFDDIAYAALVTPPLTTVAQPTFRMGAIAARLLLERIKGQGEPPYHRVLLPTTLVIRESCGARAGSARAY
jgi:DNA-binding LacI/PurR family transcriptional regulator